MKLRIQYLLAYSMLGALCATHNMHSEPVNCSANTYFNQAELFKNGGKTHEAIAAYKQTLAKNPHHVEAHFFLANELFRTGNYDEAINHYQQAVALRHDFAPAYYNLGLILNMRNNQEQAIQALENAVLYNSGHNAARILLGKLLYQQGNYALARLNLESSLAHESANEEAILIYARLLRDENNLELASTYYRKLAEAQPTNLNAQFELAYVYGQLNKFDEAVEFYTRALAIEPNCVDARINRAHTFRYLGNMAQAQQDYAIALQSRSDNAQLHYGIAESLLAQGDFKQGFAEFEYRWKRDADTRSFAHNLWDGSSLKDKTILLRAEYGQGDTIQFLRFAKHLKQQGATVILEAQDSLVELLSQCPYLDQIIPVGASLPFYDVQLPIMSLAHRMHTTAETVPQEIPYITIKPELIEEWGKKLAHDTSFKIGICWDPSPYYESFKSPMSRKSIPLELFQALARIEGVSFYSLQRMNGTEQLYNLPDGFVIHEFGSDFDMHRGRFVDTAAVMHHLDLVISVDTSVAHLAGALGTPVWVLLPHVADWRWMQNREDSPWYSTMRLFRQQVPGDWELLMEQVAQELDIYVNNSAHQGNVIRGEISVGELIDKITILEIKQEEIKHHAKLRNIITELATLNKTRALFVPRSQDIIDLTQKLKAVNKQLWVIEDDIRDKEYESDFGPEFIKLARSVYVVNDQRCKLKGMLNNAVGSRLAEEKSYKDYLNKNQ